MIEANGRSYRVPDRPTWWRASMAAIRSTSAVGWPTAILPTIARLHEAGFVGEAQAVVPTGS